MKRACVFALGAGPISLATTILLAAAPEVSAQSESGLFSEVINVDETNVLADLFLFELSGDKQFNLFEGGTAASLSIFGPADPNLTPTEINIFGSSARLIRMTAMVRANLLGGSVGVLEASEQSLVHVLGASVDQLSLDQDSVAQIDSGTIGNLKLDRGSTARVDGGLLNGVEVGGNSAIHITGGLFQASQTTQIGINEFRFRSNDSMGEISGGVIDIPVVLGPGTSLTVSGGRITSIRESAPGAQLVLVGGEFALDGVVVSSPMPSRVASSRVLTATLEDGSVIMVSGGILAGTTLVPADVPPLDSSSIIIDNGFAPASGLRPGQSLMLRDGGTIAENYRISNAKLIIQGGVVRSGLRAAFSDTVITGGQIQGFTAFGGSVSVSGGDFVSLSVAEQAVAEVTGGSFQLVSAREQSAVELSNATVQRALSLGGSIQIRSGEIGQLQVSSRTLGLVNVASRADFLGGMISGDGSAVTVWGGGVLNVSGGDFDPSRLAVLDGGALNLFVQEIRIDGQEIDLAIGQTTSINVQSESLLEATLADGSSFSYHINELDIISNSPFNFPIFTGSGFAPDAVLEATLVPEPGSALCLLGSIASVVIRRRRSHM